MFTAGQESKSEYGEIIRSPRNLYIFLKVVQEASFRQRCCFKYQPCLSDVNDDLALTNQVDSWKNRAVL